MAYNYDSSLLDMEVIVFDSIAGALRLSHKYDIANLRQWCTSQLLLCWPKNLTKMTYNAFPHAAGEPPPILAHTDHSKLLTEAIRLAREYDIPEILPAAFYALSVVRWSHKADGGQSHLQLSPADLRRLIVGREELQDHLYSILSGFDERTAPGGDTVLCATCESTYRIWLKGSLIPDASHPHGVWLLHDLQYHVNHSPLGLTFPHFLCDKAFRMRIHDYIRHLQEAIPKYFMLQS